jgi:PAS domain S-box-containing protein
VYFIDRGIGQMTDTEKDRLCRQIVEGAGDAVIFSDRDGIIRLWNRAAEGMFGYTEAEAIGQSLDLIIPEGQREAHWKGYGTVMLSGVTIYGSESLSVPAVTKGGERISIEFTINLLRDADGKVLGPAAVLRDVTARWMREKDLRRRLAFLEAGQTTL